MVRKIFIIIGIVLGSVTAFVGGTIGVMAAMGKFNTPKVHPEVLEFEESNVRIVADDQIHSFFLTGTNSYYTEKVNQTECQIWFENNVGADLIELVDKDGNPLKAQNFRYTINCNEKNYYKVKPLTNENKVKDSVAVLLARSANGKSSTNTPLTIEIDREIEQIYINKDVKSTVDKTADGKTNQNIYISTSTELVFDYVVNPEKSLKPISKYSAKEIELYFDSPYTEGYTRITKTAIENDNYLNSLFNIDDLGVVTFASTQVGAYEFRIAAFKTYQAKEEYNASLGEVENIYDRLNSMLTTKLTINVVNTNVSSVEIDVDSIVLTLYAETDKITLGETASVSGEHPIGLKMMPESPETAVRFDEVKISNILSVLNSPQNITQPTFVASTDEEEIITDVLNLGLTKENFVFSNVWLANNLVIIDHIDSNGLEYYANNGAAVAKVLVDENVVVDIEQVKLLPTGSYLDFYINSQQGNKLYDGNAFTIYDSIGEGKNRSWKVVSKELVENLRLGILVVNNEGMFEIDNLFASVAVEISATELRVNISDSSFELDVNYEFDGDKYVSHGDYLPVEFKPIEAENGIVEVVAGSFNAVVFVTKKIEPVGEQDAVYGVRVCKDIVFTAENGQKYVLVGYFNNNEFKNRVQVTADLTTSTELVLLNLQNGYQQSVENLIESLGETEVLTGYLRTEKVTITPNFVLNSNAFNENSLYYDQVTSQNIENGRYFVYAHTENHSLIISSLAKGMLKNIYEQYNLETDFADYITVNSSNIHITSVQFITGSIQVNFTSLGENQNSIYFTFNIDGNSVVSPALFIKSNQPETIVLKYNDVDEIDLSKNVNNLTSAYIEVVLGYNSGITKTLSLKDFESTLAQNLEEANLFNNEITENTSFGFTDKQFKVRSEVFYDSLNKDILTIEKDGEGNTTLNVLKTGDAVLQITINGVSSYIKVKVVTEISLVVNEQGSNSTKYKGGKAFETTYTSQPFTLDEYATLTDGIPMDSSVVSFENLVWISFGAGDLILSGNNETGYSFKTSLDAEQAVLEISVENGIWTFKRETAINIPITISFDLHTVFADILEIHLTFTSNTTAALNEKYRDQETENFILYEGLGISSLYAIYNDTISLLDNDISLILIHTNSNDPTITIKNKDNETVEHTSSWTPTTLGRHTIEINVDNIDIGPFYVTVLPNIVATAKEESATEISNGTSISEIFNLKKYGQADWFNQTVLDDFGNYYSGFAYSSDIDEITELNNDKLSVDLTSLTELNTTKFGTITLKYGVYELATANIVLKSAEIDAVVEQEFTLMANTPFDSPITFEGNQPDDIKYAGVNLEKSEGKFTIPTLTAKDDNASLIFYFGEYTYTTSLHTEIRFKLTPYIPEKLTYTAYSGTDFKLVEDVFGDLDTLKSKKSNEKIKSITILLVDQNLIYNYDSAIIGMGYFDNIENITGIIKFTEIVGESKEFNVVYRITYADNKIYNYPLTIEIVNRQSIEAVYPNQSENFYLGIYKNESDNTSFGFNFTNSQDAENLAATHIIEDIYELGGDKNNLLSYEPVLVKYNQSVTINFEEDISAEEIRRIKIANRNGNNDTLTPTIELIAWQNDGKFPLYASTITISGNSVTFPQDSTGPKGYLIFKATTNSGNFAYYIVYVCYEGRNESLDTVSNSAVVELSSGKFKLELNGKVTGISPDNKQYLHYFIIDAEVVNGSAAEIGTFNGSIFQEITDEVDIPILSNYAKIKIMAAYKDGIKIYNAGYLDVVLLPENRETSHGDLSGEYGIYTANISANKTNPFRVTDNSAPTLSFEETPSFATINGTSITLNDRVADDSKFTVLYTYSSGLVLKVTYTYLKTEIKTEASVTTGAFEDSKFNNKVKIEDLIGSSYKDKIIINGSLTIDLTNHIIIEGSLTGVNYEYVDQIDYLIFDQGIQDTNVNLTITFEKMSSVTNNSSVLVKKGLKINFQNSGGGVIPGIRLSTVASGNYSSEYGSNYGSNLVIKETEPSGDVEYYTYTIGGYTIYSLQQITTFDYTFTGNGFTEEFGADKYAAKDDSIERKINFVHLPSSKDITLGITLGEYSDQISLYVSIVKTYDSITAKYVVDGADHENIIGGDEFNLFDRLFKTTRMALVVNNVETACDFETMGFNTSTNPNFLEFSQGSTTFPAFISGEGEIQFNNVSSNTMLEVAISNHVGANIDLYTFQVMAGNKVDDLILNNQLSHGTDYISIMLEDINQSENEFDTGVVLVGKSVDTALNVINLDGYTKYRIENNVYYSGTTVVGGFPPVEFENAVAFVKNNYYFYFDLVNFNFYARYYATTDPTEDLYIENITLKGTTSKLLDNFNICFFKLKINEVYSSNYNEIYATHTINVLDKIEFNNEHLSLELNNESEVSNYLTYDSTTSLIQTYMVATSRSLDLKFNVKYTVGDDVYVVKVATYKLKIIKNIQFVVNGDDSSAYIGENISLQSTLQLNAQVAQNQQFPIYVDIKDDYVSGATNALGLNIYKMHNEHDDSSQKLENSNISVSINTIESASGIANIVTVEDGFKLKFKQDFTGDLVLTLEYTMRPGEVYRQQWYITVTGILQISYTASNPELARLQNSGLAFNSNDQVKIFDQGSYTGVGLMYSEHNYPQNGEFNADLEYVIVENNSENSALTNTELFENLGLTPISVNGTTKLSSISINLPYVQSTESSNPTTYFVVYKVTIKYLNEQNSGEDVEHVYYVAYNVVNYMAVTANAAVVDVDSRVVCDADKIYLDMFYFAEVYTKTEVISGENVTTTYTITYNSEKYFATKNGMTTEITDPIDVYIEDLINQHYVKTTISTNSYEGVYKKDSDTITITKGAYYLNGGEFTNQILTPSETDYLYNGTNKLSDLVSGMSHEVVTNYNLNDVKSVFNCSFNSIADYANFINSVSSVAMDRNNTKIHFNLEHIGSGRYGINLLKTKDNTTFNSTDPLFDNELVSDLEVYSGSTLTNKISKWSQSYGSGFKLTTNSTISSFGTVKVYEMFTVEQAGLSYMNYDILGVFNSWSIDSNLSWVKNADHSSATEVLVNGEQKTIGSYTLYKATYTGANSTFGAIYRISKDFYALKSNDGTIAVVNYALTGESNFLVLNNTLDLSQAFKVYSMQDISQTNLNKQLTFNYANITSVTLQENSRMTYSSNVLSKKVNATSGIEEVTAVVTYNNISYSLKFNVRVN